MKAWQRFMQTLIIAVTAAGWQAALPPNLQAQVVGVSDHPQLFLDDHVIGTRHHLRRDMKRPRKHPANPLLVNDRPWEQRFMQMHSVQYDPEQGHPERYMCCAESADGIHWDKPPMFAGLRLLVNAGRQRAGGGAAVLCAGRGAVCV